jgi:uncharacterized protein YecT (DUF1311 family)
MRVGVLVVVLLLGAAAGAAAAVAPRPPVIRESFTPLPCPPHPVTTLDLEGCAEKALLGSDRAIDARARKIFGLLRSKAARAAFVRGEKSWLGYRRNSCTAQSSKYAGGTLEPVAFARCEQDRNATHLTELTRTERALRQP